ncbi:sugar phosphate isomerase/epimerase family protein [Nanoarchaeota archaeon]
MAKKGYITEGFYQGGYSTLEPGYGSVFTGYRARAGSLGTSTDIRTANLLKEVSDKLASGQQVVEASLINPEMVEAIPKQHLKEVARLSKLTGAEVTVHGPVIETSGLSQEAGFSETNRQVSEKRMIQTVEKSKEINPMGNVPVTFHSTEGIPASTYGKGEKGEKVARRIIAINQETGRMVPLEEEERYYPGMEKEGEDKIEHRIHDPLEQLEIVNNTEWSNAIAQVEFNRENAERILGDVPNEWVMALAPLEKQEQLQNLTPEQTKMWQKIYSAKEYLKQAKLSADALFSKAYRFGTEKEKRKIEGMSKQYKKDLLFKGDQPTLGTINPQVQSQAMLNLVKELEQVKPDLYVPVEKFAIEKSSDTFSNVALAAYNKFKDKSPIVSIENPPASGFALSSGDDIRNLVEKSREKFVKKAVEKGIMSESKAKAQAEKLIGATWDVGHINQMRRFGFDEADVVKETEKIAPYVKHVHLSDNFGQENVELPMGMGNVPLKEMMKKLGKKGDEAKKIVEAMHWWQHFGSSPMATSLEAMGSPIYSMDMQPYWNQAIGLQQGYFGGYGQMLPTINYETFGAGFSTLPTELGGQKQGAGGRMSGTPME